ncbi:unnamed protein product [Adineta steineri]|uniref:ENTH domain-containing protein n=4 Tax=Adineta steineri TaxID=433720 RepID=A0A815DVB6_9BILA|nr:unnamed protein product [Adineta steineri]
MSIKKNHPHVINLNQLVLNVPIRRKLTDHEDRDKFEWNQWQSATKTVNNVEAPTKEKHIRNLIVGTFRLDGCRLFWSMVIRIHIESHPIVSWKFCYVIHRLLKDGHSNVVHDCIILSSYFDQLCKYWSGVQQSYGLLTHRYCHLLVAKLKFHVKNPTFTGGLTFDEPNDIRRLFKDNYNLYLPLCNELFDYMEELLNLVQVIFTSLDQSRTNSMTTTGQCRLNPIIVCIQDSSLLYDYIVKVLFKLHEGLSGDALQEHRQRLTDQFRRLKRFYNQTSTLQYFKTLIKVPILPENPPNFNIKEDMKNYQSPVPVVSATSTESLSGMDDLLTGTSTDTKSILKTTVSDDSAASNMMYNRTKEISELEQRVMQYDAMLKQNRSETDDLHRTIAAKDTELIAEKNHRLQIEEQLRQQFDNQKRIADMHAIDNKASSNEKFNKLLETYNKLRDEHAIVLNREGETKKQLTDITQQHSQLKEEHQKKDEEFNQNQEKINNEIVQLRQTNDELQDRIQVLTTERNDYQSITKTTAERMKEIENAKQNVEERFKQLENDKTRVDNDKSTFEQKLKQTEGARRDLHDKNREHEENLIDLLHDKETLELKIIDLEESARKWAQKFVETTDKQKLIQTNHEKLLSNLKRQHKFSILTYCINQMHDGIDRMKNKELSGEKNTSEYLLSKIQMAIASTKKIQDLYKKQNESDETTTLAFINECITLSNCMVDIVIYGKAASNFAQNVDLANSCRDTTLYCIDIYTNYQTPSVSNDNDKQTNELIHRLNSLIEKCKTLLKK